MPGPPCPRGTEPPRGRGWWREGRTGGRIRLAVTDGPCLCGTASSWVAISSRNDERDFQRKKRGFGL